MNRIFFKSHNSNNNTTKKKQEDTSKRTKFTKCYINEDKTKTIEVNYKQIHCLKNEKYEDIDNSLVKKNEEFIVKTNDFGISFSNELKKDKPVFTIENNDFKTKLFFNGILNKNNELEINFAKLEQESISNLENKITYKNIIPNIDLEYKIDGNRIKENIIINEKQNNYIFSFILDIGLLNIKLSNDEKYLEIIDKNNITKFIIPSPYMYDKNNRISKDVTYEIEYLSDGKISLIIKASEKWINDSTIELPIKIDPEIIIIKNYDDEKIKLLSATTDDATALYKYNSYMYTLSSIKDLVFMAFDLSDYVDLKIKNVKLIFNMQIFVSPFTLYIYDYSKSNYNMGSLLTIDTSYAEYFDTLQINTTGEVELDITSLFKSWIKDATTVGTLMFKLNYNLENEVGLYIPRINITYHIPSNTIKDYFDLDKDIIVETIHNTDIEIDTTESKIGLLTTYIDRVNFTLYQQFQDNKFFYTRNSVSENTWSNWVKHTIHAELIDGTLYLSDE